MEYNSRPLESRPALVTCYNRMNTAEVTLTWFTGSSRRSSAASTFLLDAAFFLVTPSLDALSWITAMMMWGAQDTLRGYRLVFLFIIPAEPSLQVILVQDSYIEWGSHQIIPDWMHLHHSIISLHLWSRHCTTETCHPAELCLNSWPTESLNIIKRLLFMPLVCGDLLCSNSCCNSGSQLSGL